MGSIKFLIYISVLLMHDPYFGQFFHNHAGHIAVALGTCFSFLETGYITGKQSKLNIYKSAKDFMIARFCRIYMAAFFVLIMTCIFMTNSVLFIHSKETVFNLISKLGIWDKTFYIVTHLIIFIQPYLFFEYDMHNNSFIYSLIRDDDATSAIKMSIAPHMWTIIPDIIGMILIAFVFFKKMYKTGFAILLVLILGQLWISHEILNQQLDTMWVWQNPISALVFIGIGFLYGYKDVVISFENKYISGIFGYLLVFAAIYLVSTQAEHNNMFLVINGVAVMMFMVACDFLWHMFSYKKWDMKARDMSTHIYFWHFLILSIFYCHFQPSAFNSSIIVLISIIFPIFFGPWFEKYNKRFIKFLQTKFSNRTENQ